MRKLITAFKVSLDGKSEGPQGFADWVDAWSEDYGLTEDIDACIIGGGMYPGYEAYWTAIRDEPDRPLPMSGKLATSAERVWCRFASQTPHYVLSRSVGKTQWSNTQRMRSLDDVAELKRQQGKSIYLMGGARVAASLIDAGLVDEIRLIVYPLLAGEGRALFETLGTRRTLDLTSHRMIEGGRMLLTYGMTPAAN